MEFFPPVTGTKHPNFLGFLGQNQPKKPTKRTSFLPRCAIFFPVGVTPQTPPGEGGLASPFFPVSRKMASHWIPQGPQAMACSGHICGCLITCMLSSSPQLSAPNPSPETHPSRNAMANTASSGSRRWCSWCDWPTVGWTPRLLGFLEVTAASKRNNHLIAQQHGRCFGWVHVETCDAPSHRYDRHFQQQTQRTPTPTPICPLTRPYQRAGDPLPEAPGRRPAAGQTSGAAAPGGPPCGGADSAGAGQCQGLPDPAARFVAQDLPLPRRMAGGRGVPLLGQPTDLSTPQVIALPPISPVCLHMSSDVCSVSCGSERQYSTGSLIQITMRLDDLNGAANHLILFIHYFYDIYVYCSIDIQLLF